MAINFSVFIFWFSAFIIFWAMIGYPISLMIIEKFYNFKEEIRNYNQTPTVTVMIVAHNEEKVIKEKLINITELNYPENKIEILVASDNSTDMTNKIVENYKSSNPEINIRLYKAKNRMGKTNAQNEAQKTVESEILVMTDANSMLDKNSIRELVSSFSTDDIAYVAGRLVYKNEEETETSSSESSYWDLDIKMRDIESRIQTITAGNGALYACRNVDYVDFDLIESHDSAMPIYYGLRQKRAIMNADAIVYEKAGETQEDEFGRKVRMNRVLLRHIVPNISILNIFKHKWFTYFYLGHRTSRYLLWIAHGLLLLTNVILISQHIFFVISLILQVSFYLLAIIKQFTDLDNKILNMTNYYFMTILAQWFGVFNIITGKSKPFWEKAESTR